VSRGALALALAVVAAGCSGQSPVAPARAQVVLHVDTDAPIAHETSAGAPGWGDAFPLFDRLRLDLYAPGASAPCDGCTDEFTVTYEDFASGRVSVGVVPASGDSGWVARVRLTVERFELSTGDIDPDSTVDVWVALPSVVDGQVVDVTVSLSTDATGQPAGSQDAPVDPAPGAPEASAVGTWPGAQRAGCTTKAPAGAVCVPGGAFWMGATTGSLVPGASRTWRRLVVMSPFWLGASEVTVAQARALSIDTVQVTTWSGGTSGATFDDFCTYSLTGSPRDVLPLNCVTWGGEQELCRSQGGSLPSEAQIEYAAGGALGLPFPWGQDQAACGDAVWGRDGYGIFASYIPFACRASTNFMAPMGGCEPPGRGARDVASMPGGDVTDLAGNLFESTVDSFQFSTDPCWAPHGVLHDPVCTRQSTDGPDEHTLRAGSWTTGGSYLEAGHREGFDGSTVAPDVGFRCACKG
jgi:formylglycine-generating enzyme required for sulfatase activity